MSALRRIRIDKQLSIADLAAKSDVSEDQIRNIESGGTLNPRVRTLAKLAAILEVEPSELDPILTGTASRDAA